MKRRAKLGLALAALLALTCAVAQSQPLTAITVVSIPIDVAGNAYYAADLGLFKKAGLDVSFFGATNGGAVASTVAGGGADIGSSNIVSIAQAHERGVPFVLIAPSGGNEASAPLSELIVARDSPIHGAKDLGGKTIALNGLQGISQVEVSAWLDKNGGDFHNVKYVEMPFPEMAQAVTAGRVDVALVSEPFRGPALADPGVRSLGDPATAIVPNLVEGAFFTTVQYATAHPDIIKRFGDAIVKAGIWANKNPAASAAILQKYAKTTGSVKGNRAFYPDAMRAADVQPLIDAAARYGVLKSPLAAKDMMAPGI